MALNFNQYANEGNAFLNAYTEHMGFGPDKDKAGRILSATLYALRDIIPFEESLQLIAQLPMFLKAVYVNGWTMRRRPREDQAHGGLHRDGERTGWGSRHQ